MNSSLRYAFGICLVVCLMMMAVAMHLWGAAEVRAEFGELFFLTFIGAVWIIVSAQLFSWLGLSFRDDVSGCGNVAALFALGGAMLAGAIIYIGGSLGEGPSYWNNIFSAGLGMGCFLFSWLLLELFAKVSVSITVERDLASGLRMGGFFVAAGLMLGRAVAGDWHSEEATVHDLIRDGWPVAVLWGIALVIEIFTQPTSRRPFPPYTSHGVLPAFIYLAFAGVWLWFLGRWEGMPR